MDNSFFLQEMKELLKDEYPQFVSSLDEKMYQGIRVNTLKTSYDFLSGKLNLTGERTPFDRDTWYYDDQRRLGNHPFHLAGLYYLQEPSATAVVNALDVQENQLVLDLCAAPGGKSTQILSRLNNTGLLWSNEISSSRAQILLSNIERWGSGNCILTSYSPEQLCPQLAGVFDRIVVDAPCSGASMFKKYPETVRDYNASATQACQKRQLMILDQVCSCLKEEGILVYSTCTYNLTENEAVIYQFLQDHPEFELADTQLGCGRSGYPYQQLESEKLTRIMPMDKGEGHFIAKLVKKQENRINTLKRLAFSRNKVVDEFLKEYGLKGINYTVTKDNVYISDQPLIDFSGKAIRQGILLGSIQKNRLEPHHHFFVSLKADCFENSVDLNEEQIRLFIAGNTIPVSGIKGYVRICYNGASVGFGKGDGKQIKNHLPKGLRIINQANQLL